MSIEEANREAMALLWPIRKDDGSYVVDDGLVESIISASYLSGHIDGTNAMHESYMQLLDNLTSKVQT